MKQLNTSKTLGIWGLGKTGRSIIAFLRLHNYKTIIAHAPIINHEQKQFLENNNVEFIADQNTFLNKADIIIPSPGINLNSFKEYKEKFLAELDLFCQHWEKQIIAITGSIGKTTITHILSQLLNKKKSIATGGNIGMPMLDMLTTNADYALLEVSSFQLELATLIKPNIAILTNFYPNHLDRHNSIEGYRHAKMNLVKNMQSTQHGIIPNAIIPLEQQNHITKTKAELHIFSDKEIPRSQMHAGNYYYSLHNNTIMRSKSGRVDKIPFHYNNLSFSINWLIISICLHLMKVKLAKKELENITLFENRLEKVCTINGIDIYNDSKSTVSQATLAAVAKLKSKPIHLFLGGLSKNIDRAPLIAQLKNMNVSIIYCFGQEANQLQAMCIKETIPSGSYATLDDALAACFVQAKPNENILFSPAGSSFDLFENYEKRGEYFKKLLKEVQKSNY